MQSVTHCIKKKHRAQSVGRRARASPKPRTLPTLDYPQALSPGLESRRGSGRTRPSSMKSLSPRSNFSPTPKTIHPVPYTSRHPSCVRNPTPHTIHPVPCTLHPQPYSLSHTSYTPCNRGRPARVAMSRIFLVRPCATYRGTSLKSNSTHP